MATACFLSASRRRRPGTDLPGGGLEFGEHPADAVLRELTEETGLVGMVDALLAVESFVWTAERGPHGRPHHGIFVVYAVRVVEGEQRDEVDGSSDRCAWFGPQELEALPLTRIARAVLVPGQPG
jgi:8-oxo-dGTP pyrophosphatase MutT (NUDIX family)